MMKRLRSGCTNLS